MNQYTKKAPSEQQLILYLTTEISLPQQYEPQIRVRAHSRCIVLGEGEVRVLRLPCVHTVHAVAQSPDEPTGIPRNEDGCLIEDEFIHERSETRWKVKFDKLKKKNRRQPQMRCLCVLVQKAQAFRHIQQPTLHLE